jgi:anti-sigma B factor antagonist
LTYFEIHEVQDGACLTLRLTGELDIGSVPVLRRRVEELRAEKRSVRIDLSGLEFMDSSGIHVLVGAIENARADGQEFAVQPSLSPQVKRLFELTRLATLIGVPELTTH